MSRAGRKRKAGYREPTGKLKRPTMQELNAADLASRMQEKALVLSQPHRLGDTRQECATAIGRLWVSLKTDDRTLLNAGEKYGRMVRRYRKAWGMTVERQPQEPFSEIGDPPTLEDVREWKDKIDDLEWSMMRVSCEVLFATRRVAIDGIDVVGPARDNALIGLKALATAFGMIGRKKIHPFHGAGG